MVPWCKILTLHSGRNKIELLKILEIKKLSITRVNVLSKSLERIKPKNFSNRINNVDSTIEKLFRLAPVSYTHLIFYENQNNECVNVTNTKGRGS